MLQDSYTKIRTIINKIVNYDNEKTDNIFKYLKHVKVNSYIYPSSFMDKLNFSLDDTYEILKVLRENNYIIPVFALYCFKCQHFVTHAYENLEELPLEMECNTDNCDEIIKAGTNTVAYFKVIKRREEDSNE